MIVFSFSSLVQIMKNQVFARNFTKELTLCHKLWFSNPYIFGFQRRKPLIFQTMTFDRSKNISLKYQRFTTLASKDIGIRKSEFVAKSQFLCSSVINNTPSLNNFFLVGGGSNPHLTPGIAYGRLIIFLILKSINTNRNLILLDRTQGAWSVLKNYFK